MRSNATSIDFVRLRSLDEEALEIALGGAGGTWHPLTWDKRRSRKIDDEERHPSRPRANAAARRAAPAEINARKLSPRHF